MKKIITLLLIFLFLACSTNNDDSPEQTSFEEFISINGDTRNLTSLNSVTIDRYEADLLTTQLQLSLELEDPSRNTIGDIGGFKNESIRLWVTIYTDDELGPNLINYSTLHDDSIDGNVPSSVDKINIFINLLTDEEDEKIYGSAENNQSAKAHIEDGYLIVEWNELKFVKSYEYSELEFISSGRLKGRIVRNDR